MNYYPFHIGDYAAHTGHLDPLEDVAYRRAIDAYMLTEAPLPTDPADVARRIRMRDHVAVVESVLREFFKLTPEGWRHSRCDAEIAKVQSKSEKASTSAALRWKGKRNADAKPTDTGVDANAMRTHTEGNAPNTQDPIPKEETHTPRATAVELAVAIRQAGVAANSANPQVIALAEQGVTAETARAACEEARERLPGESVSLGYVVKILESWAKRAGAAHVNGATVPRKGLTDDAIARIQAELEAEERNAAARL